MAKTFCLEGPEKTPIDVVDETVDRLDCATIENTADVSGFCRTTVRKYLAELEIAGKVRHVRCGNAKIFMRIR